MRRDKVIELLQEINNLTIYGTISESEGIDKIRALERVDFVLIGGRYTTSQRVRIKQFIHDGFPHIKITEPGIDYPYSELSIFNEISRLVLQERDL